MHPNSNSTVPERLYHRSFASDTTESSIHRCNHSKSIGRPSRRAGISACRHQRTDVPPVLPCNCTCTLESSPDRTRHKGIPTFRTKCLRTWDTALRTPFPPAVIMNGPNVSPRLSPLTTIRQTSHCSCSTTADYLRLGKAPLLAPRRPQLAVPRAARPRATVRK